MTTPTPTPTPDRWSAETEELVERAQRAHWHGTDGWTAGGHSTDPDDCAACWEATDVALTALADAGVLLPVGGKAQQQLGAWSDGIGMVRPAILRETPTHVRTVITTPWREVTDDPHP